MKKELHRVETDPAQFAALAKVLAKKLGALGSYEYEDEREARSAGVKIPPTATP